MIRWASCVLILIVTLSLTACGIKTSSRPSTAADADSRPTTQVTSRDASGVDAVDRPSDPTDPVQELTPDASDAADADTADAHAADATAPSADGASSLSGDEHAAVGHSAARDAADRRAVADDDEGTIEITFDDIDLPIQEDMVFRPFMMTDRARELDGKRIRIHGYMLPDSKTRGITEFVLLKNTECKFGPGGAADHLVSVQMIDGTDARFRDDPVSVEGILKIEPFTGPDGNTWSIFELACDRVQRYRPRR